MVPYGSSPVARLYLAKNETPEEEASGVRKAGFDCIAFFAILVGVAIVLA